MDGPRSRARAGPASNPPSDAPRRDPNWETQADMHASFWRSGIAALLTFLCLGLAVDAAPDAIFDGDIGDPAAEQLLGALDAAAETADAGALQRYIVVLDDPSVASYRGGISGLAPTAVEAAGGKVIDGKTSIHLDVDSRAARAYRAYLARQQETTIARLRYLAPELEAGSWRYDLVLNGFAARMSPKSAAAAMRLAGVRLVYPAEELVPEMDSTQNLIGAVEAWEAAGGVAEAGLGARVATMEAATAPNHPFFNDEGMPDAPDGGPSAKAVLADGSEIDLLENSPHPEAIVNNKAVGLRVFAEQLNDTQIAQLRSGTYVSSHGTHVAGTMTGRHGTYEILDGVEVEMAGVAPMAWLYAYSVEGETPEMLAAFEMMAVEEIDAVNLSLGTITWLTDRPETHPVSVAMSGAADAGSLGAGSAGNAGGNGRTSLSGGWKYSEDLMVVGNTSSTGRTGVPIGFEQDDLPDPVLNLLSGTVGSSSVITGTLAWDENAACAENPDFEGKIAVAIYLAAEGGLANCSTNFIGRFANMAASGAKGMIMLLLDRPEGVTVGNAVPIEGRFVGANGGLELMDLLKAGEELDVTLEAQMARDYLGQADILSGSSSRGPGLDWTIKPDISAPGTNIISSVLVDEDPNDNTNPPTIAQWPAYSGTSMSAPHITGSAGLLRSMHPDWSVRHLRSAMINTSVNSVVTGDLDDLRPADPTEGGPGRINLAEAHDPRAFLDPPKASFGALDAGEAREVEILIESDLLEPVIWELSMEPGAGDARVSVEPERLRLEPGDVASFTVHIDTDGASEHEHWGDVVLQQRPAPPAPEGIFLPALMRNATLGEDPEAGMLAAGEALDGQAQDDEEEEEDLRRLRLVYYAYLNVPEDRDDVLIIDWTYGDTPDHSQFYIDALDELGLSHSVWAMGENTDHAEDVLEDMHPTYEEMYRHDLVILNSNESQVSLQKALAGQYQYQNYLLGGGSMLMAGQGTQGWWRYLSDGVLAPLPDNDAARAAFPDTWPHRWLGPSQNGGCEMCLARYFAGYTPGLTATLSSRLLVPYPMAPDMPEMEVDLAPHPDAAGLFDYGLDLSTGAMAKDGAAGNQYRFNSGSVVEAFKANTGNAAADLGDVVDGMLVERTVPAAHPLWSYPVEISGTMGMSTTLNTVGTYVAGKADPESDIAWNAMYWGFGLEGVGKDGEDTASRSELLGDTYNFLALNMAPEGGLVVDADGRARLTVDLGPAAAPVRFTHATVDWGDGRVERVDFAGAMTASEIGLVHDYGSRPAAESRGTLRVTLQPVRGEAAPVRLRIAAGEDRG